MELITITEVRMGWITFPEIQVMLITYQWIMKLRTSLGILESLITCTVNAVELIIYPVVGKEQMTYQEAIEGIVKKQMTYQEIMILKLRTNQVGVAGLITCTVGAVELITNQGVVRKLRTNQEGMERLITCAVVAVELIANQGILIKKMNVRR